MSEVATLSPPPAAVPSGGGLVAAIAAVMNEVHVVAKRGENEFHRYRYATMGDILKEITPLLGRHGIVIFQSETGRAMFDDDNVIAIEYAFTVAHASGETWPHVIKQTGVSTCRNSKGGWDDKSLNKCHTAARKYFLLSLFQIPTGEEDDADQGDRRPPPSPSWRHKPGNSTSVIRRRMTPHRKGVRPPGRSIARSIRCATNFRHTARRRRPRRNQRSPPSTTPTSTARRRSCAASPTATLRHKSRPTSTWWEATDDEDRSRPAARAGARPGADGQAAGIRRLPAAGKPLRRRRRSRGDVGGGPEAAVCPQRQRLQPAMT